MKGASARPALPAHRTGNHRPEHGTDRALRGIAPWEIWFPRAPGLAREDARA